MSFTQAVLTCLGKYATFRGRASRPEYWWFSLFVLLTTAVVTVLDAVLQTDGWLLFLALLGFAVPLIAAATRRLHDRGLSGWLNLLTLLPGAGGIALTVLLLLAGDEGANKYGEACVSPEEARRKAEIAAFHARPAGARLDAFQG